MRLDRLEILGFKSFAEPVTLEFPEQITAVVGPNGSGKSNIVDAVRWVLGEQSTSVLRCSRMDEVIFSGSELRRRLGLAEVCAVFQRADGEELAVSRRLDRSGRSDYLIDGRRCRLRDVQELFMDTGLGRARYAVISQGEVQRIIQARGDEIRAYLEEVAGVTRYRMMLQRSEGALLTSGDHIRRFSDALQVRREYLGPLREQAKRARLHRILSNRERRLRTRVAAEELRRISRELDDIKRRASELDSERERLRQEEIDLGDRRSHLNREVDDLGRRKDLLDRGRARLVEKGSETRSRLAVMEERLRALTASAKRAEQALSDVDRMQGELDSTEDHQPEELEVRLGEMRDLVEELSQDVLARERDLGEAEAVVSRCMRIDADLRLDARSNSRDIEGIERELQSCFSLISRAAARIEDLDSHDGGEPSDSDELSRMKERNREAEQRLAETSVQLEACRRQRDRLTRETTIMNDRLARWETRLQTLMQVIDGEAAAGVTSDAPVGERPAALLYHLQVPDTCAVAVELALGPWVGAELCSDDDPLDAGVSVLAHIMSSRPVAASLHRWQDQRRWWEEHLVDAGWGESVLGWLDDLVDFDGPDDALQSVCAYYFSRYLVVESTPDLMGILSELWRDGEGEGGCLESSPDALPPVFITPRGDMVDAAGAVHLADGADGVADSSGVTAMYAEIRKLRAGVRETRSELARLKGQLEGVGEQYELYRDEHAQLERDHQQLLGELAQYERHEEERMHGRRRRDRQLEAARQERDELTQRVGELEREKARLERESDRLTRAREELAKHREVYQGRVDGMRDELNDLREKHEKCRYESYTVGEQLSALRGRREESDRERQRLKEQESKWHDSLAELEEEIRRAESERARLRERDRALQAALDRTTTLVREERDSLDGMLRKLEEAREHLDRVTKKRESIDNAAGNLRVAEARALGELQGARRTARELGLDVDEAVTDADESADAADLNRWRRRLSRLEGARAELEPVNPLAIDEYRRERHEMRAMQLGWRDLTNSLEALQQLSEIIEVRLDARFRRTLRRVSRAFHRTFTDLFGGGQAELHIRQDAVELHVQPPGKRLSRLSLLSGGERALAGIAFLFALIELRPAPVCVFDEIDAPLDDVNTERFAGYLNNRRDGVQYLLITHQKRTMEIADALHGVTMAEPGVSQLVSVRLEDAARYGQRDDTEVGAHG